MNKEQFINLLLKQQDRGKSLLSLVSNMHESQNDFGDGMAMFGEEDLYYVPEEELDDFNNKFSQWKSYVRELLESQFGSDDQYVYDWETYVATSVSKRKPILNQLKKNVNKGLSLIDSFLERIDIHFHIDEKIEQENMAKPPKIFISHSSEDKELISSFIENILILGLGLNTDDIAFTSHEIYGVKPGDKINQYIKDHIAAAEVVLFMISDNYKESEVCLNEMGATWALDKNFISVLLPYAGFDKLGWLTLYEKGIQIYEKDDVVSLCQKISEFLQIDVVSRLNALFIYLEKFKNDISRYYRMPIGTFDN